MYHYQHNVMGERADWQDGHHVRDSAVRHLVFIYIYGVSGEEDEVLVGVSE